VKRLFDLYEKAYIAYRATQTFAALCPLWSDRTARFGPQRSSADVLFRPSPCRLQKYVREFGADVSLRVLPNLLAPRPSFQGFKKPRGRSSHPHLDVPRGYAGIRQWSGGRPLSTELRRDPSDSCATSANRGEPRDALVSPEPTAPAAAAGPVESFFLLIKQCRKREQHRAACTSEDTKRDFSEFRHGAPDTSGNLHYRT